MKDYHDIIEYFQSKGKKTFTLSDVVSFKSGNINSARLSVSKLIKKDYIKPLAKGFYVIFSPSEKVSGEIPPDTYIDQLLGKKDISYYIGLLSSASFYGATHYRPMVYQIVTDTQVRIPKKYIKGLDFHFKRHFPVHCIDKKKGQYGFLNIASPALTMYDIVKYQKAVGTIENTLLVLAELLPQDKISDFRNLLKNKIEIAAVQRLGFILEKLGNKKFSKYLLPIAEKATAYVPLSLTDNIKGVKNTDWKIIVNKKLEF